MKFPNVTAAFLILGAFSLFSCKELENLNLTDVSAPVSTDFVVYATDSIAEKSETVDASTNQDYMNNRSKIDDLEISRIDFRLKTIAPNSADSLISGKFEFLNPVTNNYEVLASLNNHKLKVGEIKNLVFDAVVADKLVGIYKSADPKATIRFKAQANKKPVDCTVSTTLYLKLKVKL